MCLSFQLTKNDETVKDAHRKFKLKHNDKISCDNSMVHIHQRSDGTTIVINQILLFGAPSIILPMEEEFEQYLTKCSKLPCLAAELDATINPDKYVRYEEQTYPVYRSLSTSIPDINSIQIAPLKIIKNPDGGVIAILPVGRYIERNITQEKRASLGPKMLECIKQGLMSIGMTLKDVIGTDDDMTEFALLNFLFDAVTPDCDIIIGIMPPGKTEGTFTFCFNIEKGVNKIPILGLTHGDKKVLQDVENTFYVTGNKHLKVTFKADQPYEGETDKDFNKDVSFLIKSPDKFTHDHYRPLKEFEDEIDTVYDGERGISSHGNSIWQENQKTFQELCVNKYKDSISEFIKATFSDKRVIWNGLYLTELKEHVAVIPRNTTKAYIEIY